MGKRGNKTKASGMGKSGTKGGMGADLSGLMDELSLLSPQKRNELNNKVDKLLNLSSVTSVNEVGGGAPLNPNQLYEQYEEIQKILEEIQGLEVENMNRKIPLNRKKYLASFMDWMKSNGAWIHSDLTVDETQKSGFGLFVKGEEGGGIKYGEEALKIPRKCMMSTETAKDSSIGPLIERDPMLKTMSNVVLALHLLIEKNSPASFWEPYINVLPSSYNTVLYFTPDDFMALKGSPSAFEDALKQYKFVARQYAYFYKKFQGTMLRDYFTYHEYRWAVSTVMTRQNQIPSAKKENEGDLRHMINALIPLWDMCNHREGELSTDFDPETETSKCLANKDFGPGEEFTIYYGVRANIDLLIHNGFVPAEPNKSDCLSLKLGLGKKDPLYGDKAALLEKLTAPVCGLYYLGSSISAPIDGLLMAFLRVNCMTSKDEIDSWIKDETCRQLLDVLKDDEKLSELDTKALNYIKIRCDLLSRAYPTSIEQDQEILKKEDLTDKRRFCVQLRLKEKEILNATINYCTTKLN